ncbi:MAG: hypothetical protein LBC85_09650 [Fibromonadaceae bacterium]|jgi:DNA-binding NtrC family response regulator|nr:hypothetical protein [Fibromonadaceae bacterium]
MVKSEEYYESFDDLEDFRDEVPSVVPQNYDYKLRRILVWVADEEILSMVEETLGVMLPLATIKVVNNEEEALDLSDKDEWDTFVVDLTEEGVSSSEFVKMANNSVNLLVALNYSNLNREGDQYATYSEPIRKLFDLDALNTQIEEPQE